MKCSYCGFENRNDAKFCVKCGKEIIIQSKPERDTRYDRQFSLHDDLYSAEIQIELCNGGLYIGDVTKRVFAQFKMKNLSDEGIKAVKIMIDQKDAFQNHLGIVDYNYVDLNVLNNQYFGDGIPIELNQLTRSLTMKIGSIVYSSGKVLNDIQMEWTELPKQTLLSEEFSQAAFDQYLHEFNKAKYHPLEWNHLRLCTCGNVFSEKLEECPVCGNSFNALLNRLNQEELELENSYQKACRQMENCHEIADYLQCAEKFTALKEYKDSNLKKEQCLENSEKLRISLAKQEENKLKKKQKRKRAAIIGSAAAVLLAVGLILFRSELQPYFTYKNASALVSSGKYDQAISKYESLGNYKDSKDQITETKYLQANAYVKQENYRAAIDIYTKIKSYKDVSELLTSAYYNYALQLINDENYSKALVWLNKCSKLNDIKELKAETYYNLGCQQYDQGNYEKAIDSFGHCSNYKDASDQRIAARYAYGKQLMNENDYEEAINQFLSCGNYQDAAAKVLEAKFAYAKSNADSNKAYDYLTELIAVNYSGAQEYYNQLYGWNISFVALNYSESDESTNYSSVSKYNTWYCHFKVSGGPPNGSVSLSYNVIWPDGSSSSKAFEGVFYDGSTSWVNGWYDSPEYGTTGTCTVTIYINGTAMCSKSFTITN